jgi:hypothetical protein
VPDLAQFAESRNQTIVSSLFLRRCPLRCLSPQARFTTSQTQRTNIVPKHEGPQLNLTVGELKAIRTELGMRYIFLKQHPLPDGNPATLELLKTILDKLQILYQIWV